MHDLLYESQDDLANEDFSRYALKLGLEIYKFEAEFAGQHAKRVRDDFRGGVRSGVNGTPTFFINNVRYNGTLDYEALKKAILKAASSVTSGPAR
jgi:protein-disulfide isomerase